jgi:hypothetical protein
MKYIVKIDLKSAMNWLKLWHTLYEFCMYFYPGEAWKWNNALKEGIL